MSEEQIKRFEERLTRYAENLKKSGHAEAAVAVQAIAEAFAQENYIKEPVET